ncbi:MAG: aminotransferase class I/II-fold pyridoxal phosphate-dependent enzyme [Geminicoccaceae bacterium]
MADLEAIGGPLDGVIVASPANPTGSLIDLAELAAIARWCDARGVRLISDEIYHGITYGRPGSTAPASSTRAIVVNSFSKYWAMTGWRIGWLVLPDELVDPVERLAQNLFISPSAVGQHAAIGALGAKPELDARVAGYGENRALLLDALPRIGLDRLVPPDGAFYLYADIGRFGLDSVDFCARLLADTGVAITPGNDFDTSPAATIMSASPSPVRCTTIEQAIDRLGPWLARLDRR